MATDTIGRRNGRSIILVTIFSRRSLWRWLHANGNSMGRSEATTMKYRVVQDTRKGGNHLWYGRAVHNTTLDLESIAERIQRNCSMKKSDVLGVLTEMVEVMNDELRDGNKIKLSGIGTFYLNMRSGGAIDEKSYSITEHLRGVRVKFLAEGKKSNGVMTRAFTTGISWEKATPTVQ